MSHVQSTQNRALAAESLQEAITLSSQGAFEKAAAMLERGLEALGNDYAPETVKDDTGQKLVLARHRSSQGDQAGAATMMERILKTRIAMADRR